MKKIVLCLLLTLISLSSAWAGDAAPTPESNKTMIDLVQSEPFAPIYVKAATAAEANPEQ